MAVTVVVVSVADLVVVVVTQVAVVVLTAIVPLTTTVVAHRLQRVRTVHARPLLQLQALTPMRAIALLVQNVRLDTVERFRLLAVPMFRV